MAWLAAIPTFVVGGLAIALLGPLLGRLLLTPQHDMQRALERKGFVFTAEADDGGTGLWTERGAR